MDYTSVINGHTLEYFDDSHTYLVDGVQVPSITEILQVRFGKRFDGVDPSVLKEAARKGTMVHEAIESYCRTGEESDLPEVRGFKFLQKMYHFTVLDNEVPVILFQKNRAWLVPRAAGRLDLVLLQDGKIGIGDIKRTSKLDKDYLAYQLNLYRIAYMQSYGNNVEFLAGLHLRETTRKFVRLPIDEEMAMELFREYERCGNEA